MSLSDHSMVILFMFMLIGERFTLCESRRVRPRHHLLRHLALFHDHFQSLALQRKEETHQVIIKSLRYGTWLHCSHVVLTNYKGAQKMVLNQDSSPFQSSPFNTSEANSSPRLFWQGRDPATPNRFKDSENGIFGQRDGSPSPTRRSSIEKLQRASRVKNSNMFAREQKQEYDPTSMPVIERPLAKQIQGNAYGGSGLEGLRRTESKAGTPLYSPAKTPLGPNGNGLANNISPSKDQVSPTKSSLSSRNFNPKASYNSENGTWSEEVSGDERVLPPGRALHRHAKSVTFDAAPPQVNEYEMRTPDLSSVGTGSRENSYDSEEEEEDSYNRSESQEREDSFDASLEDTDKTPVVGPDDWRHASPLTQRGTMGGRLYDPFDEPHGSPMPDFEPSTPSAARPNASRNDSLNSNGDHRPLPPLPGMMDATASPQTPNGLSAAAERASSSQRNLPSPPKAAAISKSDLQGMAGGKMTLEERLRLMMIQDDDAPKTAAEQQRERRMRRAGARDRNSQTPEKDNGQINIYEDEDTLGELGEYQLPARISRESILRKVNGQESNGKETEYNFSSPAPSSSPERPASLDPDVPLPSTEADSILESVAADESVIIKPEQEDSELDVYAIPEMYERTESRMEDYDYDSLIHHDLGNEEDTESQYSDPTPVVHSPQPGSNSTIEEEGPATPRATSPVQDAPATESTKEVEQGGLPDFTSLSNNDFGLSLSSYMTPSPPLEKQDEKMFSASMSQAHEYLQRPSTPEDKIRSFPKPDYDGSGWGPQDDEESEPGTPESVIRHPVAPSPPRDSPAIPDQVATIKSASGSRLKTRPSATPSDLMAMREARRQISAEMPNIPPIPDRHRNRPSSLVLDRPLSQIENMDGLDNKMERQSSFKKKSLTLDIGGDLGLSLDKDFDRVIEAQKVAFDLSCSSSYSTTTFFYGSGNGNGSAKAGQVSPRAADSDLAKFLELNANITPRKQRGYLMRQNTKLVVASSDVDKVDDFRGTRSAGNSPVKKERPQSWTVEPWNGRKKSVRDSVGPRKKVGSGPAPPLPGFESNVGLGILTEEEPAPEPAVGENGERGRLFVKVIGVKDLDLPLPKSKFLVIICWAQTDTLAGERTWFSLTLDNGVHCVTTAWLELGRNAPIGQEFELVVPNELEFQLTLNVKLDKPEPKRVVESPRKAIKPQKSSTFSRVFQSPKKRKELEMKQKEEEQRVAEQNRRDAQVQRLATVATAWDLLSPLAAEDGSFGRSYVCLKDHENRCFGRPYIVDVACFNEWATEEATATSSVKSKRGNTHVKRRAPYKVGKLELQLLFVPKPKGAKEDDMPKSMNSCIREMKEAELALGRSFEGHLSQQGGDCPVCCPQSFLFA